MNTLEAPVGRAIFNHQGSTLNDALAIVAGPRNANGGTTRYVVHIDESTELGQAAKETVYVTLAFQDGPLADGINGITDEALIAIVADRLEGFQEGPYRCRENACAKTHLEEALHWLQSRTRQRQKRGVEGTHIV